MPLTIASNLTFIRLAAGEPFVVRMSVDQGLDADARAFVMSVYGPGRTLQSTIDGEQNGNLFEFIRDGSWSEDLYGKTGLKIEIAERLKGGRAVLATPTLNIDVSAETVADFPNGVTSRSAAMIDAAYSETGVVSVSGRAIPYEDADPDQGAEFTQQPEVSPTEGTVGQVFTAAPGTVTNGSITSRVWKLGATTISAALTATPTAAGALTYQEFAGSVASAIQTATVALAGAASTYLPTVSSTGVPFGAKRMVASYNGPLYQLTRTGGATMDVSAKGASGTAANDLPDYTTVIAFLAGDTMPTVTKIYDQSGGGKHAVPSGVAPLFDVTQALAGCSPFLFGYNARMDAPVAVNRNNFSVIDAIQLGSTADANAALWSLQAGGGNIAGLYYGSGSPLSSAQYYDGANNTLPSPVPLALRSNASVIGFTSSGTERRLFARETSGAYTGTSSSSVSDTFSIGYFNFGGGWYMKGQRWGTVLYPTALSPSEVATVRDALTAMFSIPTTFTSRLVMVADSIGSGLQARLSKNLSYLFSVSKPQMELFNLGFSGQSLATAYGVRTSNENLLYTGSYGAGKCTLLIASGTNDIGNDGQTDAQVYTTLTNYVSAEKTVGYKVIAASILPRTDAAWNGTKEGYRTAYRTRINGNVAGADAVIDIADPATTMGGLTAPDNANLYADKLHPNDSPNGGGYAPLAALYLASPAISTL